MTLDTVLDNYLRKVTELPKHPCNSELFSGNSAIDVQKNNFRLECSVECFQKPLSRYSCLSHKPAIPQTLREYHDNTIV